MKRPAVKGGLVLRSNWLRLLILFIVFGVIFAAQRAVTGSPKSSVDTTEVVVEETKPVIVPEMSSIFDFSAKNIDGEMTRLKKYQNRVTVILNGATVWGVTKRNYLQLQELYKRYEPLGLSILVFPCNQFGGQEPKSNPEIKKDVTSKFGVTFDLFEKIEVNGPNALPLFSFLKKETGGKDIQWNFEKFLIDHTGKPYKRYMTNTDPTDMEADIVTLLNRIPGAK